MKIGWKDVLIKLVAIAFTAGILSIFLFYSLVFISLSGWPPYLQRAMQVFLPCLLIVGALSMHLPWRWCRRLLFPLLAVAIGCGVYCGYGLWRDSLPTMEEADRYTLLSRYKPFQEGTLTARLDAPASLSLEGQDLPRLDGATALYPVYAAFVEAVYPEGDYPFSKEPGGRSVKVACTGTVDAYERLVSGETDLIFAAAPSQAQLDMAAQAGKELFLTPIGREAFVFFVNSKNPVEELSIEEIQGIYTGQITNWDQVGGNDQSIRPFQRMENSGSQSALLRLMDGLPLIEPEKEDRVADMGGIIQQVADYRNYQNAIGFSFRFYSTQMVQDGDIRLLALDGVFPTKETIRDGSYPISNPFYAVTAAPAGQGAPQDRDPVLSALLEWVLSPEGQALVEESGYVSMA